ncbi:MAG TPA: 2OG-Fe(II) oxygenase family protein [Usitatibacter sp.]|nr:2OG-Fe(II) oxygenase family protein [Usitatibacter sp.]
MPLPPSRRMNFSEVPVVDIGPLVAGDSRGSDEVIANIDRACTEVGFMYAVGHGVPRSVVQAAVDATRGFFALPLERKMEVWMGHSDQFRGFIPNKAGGTKSAKNHREGYIIRAERPRSADQPMDGPNQWPKHPREFEGAMRAYYEATDGLARILRRGFSRALGLHANALEPMFEHSMTQLKLNYYPAQDSPEKEDEIGLVAHADSGAFTILWQDDVGGLETVNREGEWVVVPPIPDAFVINIGDILQAWSNGRFSSTPHRVINRYGTERISIPLFVNPNYNTVVKPLVGAAPPEFVPFVSGEYQTDVYDRLYPRAPA